MANKSDVPSGEHSSSAEKQVTLKDWVIVLVACLGAFMAVLDIQITNSSLADIQGALGATLDEGSWISTAYLITEIIVIPLTAWLTRVFGFKQYLLASSFVFVILSCACATAHDLNSMIFYRAIQGFSGGALIPLAMEVIISKLPPSKINIGMAIFGLSATFAPAIGPSLGGYLTDSFGWPCIFYLNIIPGIIQISILQVLLEPSRPNFSLLKEGDWFGIATLAIGLGCLEVFLEEGNRKDWFGSQLIVVCAIVASISLTVWFINELRVKNPVVDLRLFTKRNFLFCGIANLAVGADLYGPGYLMPVYFSQIHGYNALQIGLVLMWFGLPQLLVTPLVPVLMKHIDGRIMIFFGLALFVISFFMTGFLNLDYSGPQFIFPLILRAIGLPLVFVPLSGMATEGIEPSRIGSASSLYNMTRNLGGSFGIALIGTFLTQREKFHSQFIGESVSVFSAAAGDRIEAITQALESKGIPLEFAQSQAVAIIDNTIRRESNIMAFSDSFLLFSAVTAIACIVVLFLRKSTGGAAQGMH